MNILKRILVNIIAGSYIWPSRIRIRLLKLGGIEMNGKGIRAKCFFNSEHVKIGQGSSIAFFVSFIQLQFQKDILILGKIVGLV